MNKVYAVCAGAYSDYHVEAIFSTEEAAQHYIDSANAAVGATFSDYRNIEEYELDPEVVVQPIMVVSMKRDGTVIRTNGSETKVTLGRRLMAPYIAFGWSDRSTWLVNEVATDDEKQAIKRTNEIRTQLIAFDLFPVTIPIGSGSYDLNNEIRRRYE